MMLIDAGHRFGQLFHIVDDDHRRRASLSVRVIRSGGHAEIYENLDELLDAKPAFGAVLIELPDRGVKGLPEALHRAGIPLPVIVFASHPTPAQVIRAAHEGVADFIYEDFADDDLVAAYAYATRFVERNSAVMLRAQQARAQIDALTAREKQILSLLLEGHSNKSMGKALELSPRTIEDYRLNALKKLGVTSTSAAIRIGIEAGLNFVTSDSARYGTGASRAIELY